MAIRTITIQKISNNRLNPDIMRAHLEKFRNRIMGGARISQGWNLVEPRIVVPNGVSFDDKIMYRYTYRLEKIGGRAGTEEKQFEDIVNVVKRAINLNKWEYVGEATEFHQAPVKVLKLVNDPPAPPCRSLDTDGIWNETINLDRSNFFDGIFDREAAIEIMHSSLTTAVETNFDIRPHCVLTGPPSAGKTTLVNALANMAGEHNVFRLDATTSTQAGILKELGLSGPTIPYTILIIEEIEKANPDHFRWLLALMDHRGEIRVMNAKSEPYRKAWRPIVFATVNDYDRFAKSMDGALASRFSNTIYTPAISRENIIKAVLQGAKAIGAEQSWVEAAMEFRPNADIRELISLVATGRARLLDGSYQGLIAATQG